MSAFDIDQITYTACPCGKDQIETQIGTPGHCWSLQQITKHKIHCATCAVHWEFDWKDELVRTNKATVVQD
jgi:hypothetical protein